MATIERYHDGEYGKQTVAGPAFPDVDENVLNDIAVRLMALGDRLDGEVIPHHAHQRMTLADWQGEAGRLAEQSATAVLGSYGAACKAAYEAARKVFRAESAVVQTKNAVNKTAEIIEQVCQAFKTASRNMLAAEEVAKNAGDMESANAFHNSAVTFANLIQTMITAGRTENINAVAACATGLASELGVPPGTAGADGKVPTLPPQSQLPGAPVPAGSAPGTNVPGVGMGAGVPGAGVPGAVPGQAPSTPPSGMGGGSAGESKPGRAPAEAGGDGPASMGAGTPGVAKPEAVPQPAKHAPDVPPPPPGDSGGSSTTTAGGPLMAMGGNRQSTSGASQPSGPSTSTGAGAMSSSPSATTGGPGSGQQGTGQGTGQGAGQPIGQGQGQQTPKNPFGQLPTQPLGAAAPAAPLTTPEPATQTGAASGTPAAASGAASGAGAGGAAPVTQAAGAASAAAPTGTPAGAAPAAPLGPAPTPPPAAPVAQPGAGAGGPAGPGVAPMSTNQQQNAAAAAPIPVTAARAERDALAAAARAGLVRKSAGDADVQFAERIAAALHAPPSIPAMAWNFVWAVGVTTDGEIIAANSYGVSFIPDGMCLPSQVIFVSADERVPAGQRGRWVREPFVALQAWCTFHEKTLKVVIGTEQEVQPFAGSLQTRVIPPEDIPTDGLMKGRTRLEVIAPEAAAKLAEWPDAQLHEALPPQPVQLIPPDPAAIGKAWMESIRPLMQTTGETYRTAHLEKLAAYGRLQESAALYRAYTAPYAADLRAAITDWVWWQQFSTIQGDAQLVELGA